TPYQPELSQGALQVFFEYQTLICMLTGMDISNASMYDGASALAEAALMAIDGTQRNKVLLSEAIHPEYRKVLQTYLHHLDVEIITIPCAEGLTSMSEMEEKLSGETAAVLMQSPNFFGVIEDLEKAAALAKKVGALSIASVDPISLSLLRTPGELGLDIATGEGQGLGSPMFFGGPGFGFLACRMERVRRLPGRVVGQTVDHDGRPAYVLTFQTREQHIRRERATSNICTNHALIAIRAAIYLASLGRTGFTKLGEIIVAKAHEAAKKITALDGYESGFDLPFFKEFVVRCPAPVSLINAKLRENNITGGYELGRDYPGMEKMMLLCVTEMTSDQDVERLINVLKEIKV
ncbi:MAG: aminomethyl-transferring glycine dehydrogenase subunit GcvPA, partial [Planctomycetota bacterium]